MSGVFMFRIVYDQSHVAVNIVSTTCFSRRIPAHPAAIEFFVHLSLAAGVASVNSLSIDSAVEQQQQLQQQQASHRHHPYDTLSRSESHPLPNPLTAPQQHHQLQQQLQQHQQQHQQQQQHLLQTSVIPTVVPPLTLQWRSLANVEYLTDGGNSWIHSAVYQGKPVVIKTLKPEAQDLVLAMNEMETEMALHARLSHENIVSLIGAGTTSKGVRFLVLERLDGGTLAQMLGYDTRIRDRRRRFWRKKLFSYLDVLRIGRATAEAMRYLHEDAIPGCTVLHRDLKPDNIGTNDCCFSSTMVDVVVVCVCVCVCVCLLNQMVYSHDDMEKQDSPWKGRSKCWILDWPGFWNIPVLNRTPCTK
jgi:Protein kinase domain